MNIACVYTLESFADVKKPLSSAAEIPFGIAIIATVLQSAGHNVSMLVFSPDSLYKKTLEQHIETYHPQLICLTSVSTQFPFIRIIADLIKELDPSIFVFLGGHQASLNPDSTVTIPSIDAICVGEGEKASVELADMLEKGRPVTSIPNLYIRRADNTIEKNEPAPFNQDLDSLPYIDRTMWEPWIVEPNRYHSVLVGRGCPYRCTYCANYAMKRLSSGRFVRYRSPENIIGEIDYIITLYPTCKNIYLEMETIGADFKKAMALFSQLGEYNRRRQQPTNFGVNLAFTSAFVRNEERCREFLSTLRRCHVTYIKIGLESGSEQVRREILCRPNYSNDDLYKFTRIVKAYGINLYWFVMIGVPGESLSDYFQTVEVCRVGKPKHVNLSIFYPYTGTYLHDLALERGLFVSGELSEKAERGRAYLDLPDFSRRQIRREYILFWFRVYWGYWSIDRILAGTIRSLISAYPHIYSLAKFLSTHSKVFRLLRDRYAPRSESLIPVEFDADTHAPVEAHARDAE